MSDSINNLSFLSYYFLIYKSKRIKLTFQKEFSSDSMPLTNSHQKTSKHANKRG